MSRRRYEILKSRLDAFSRLSAQVERGDARAIHRTRVASRRLRELVPVLQVDADRCRRLMRDLRHVTRQLGKLREPDVLAALVEDLQRQVSRTKGRALAAILTEAKSSRPELHRRAKKAGLGKRLARVARRLERVAAGLQTDERRTTRRWVWALEARIARRAASLGAAVGTAGPVYLPERLHDVRKAIKKLRYAVELLHDVDPGADRAVLARLRRWQELLGSLHDRQVVIARIRQVQAAAGGTGDARTRTELDAILADLENECRRMHGRYVKGQRDLLALCERLIARPPASPADKSSRKRVARSAFASAS